MPPLCRGGDNLHSGQMRSWRDGLLGLCLLAFGGQTAPAAEVDACSAATVEIDEKAGPLGGNEGTRRSGPKAAQLGGGHGFYPVRGKLAPPSVSKAPLELFITTRELSSPGQPIKLALRFVNRSQSPQIVLRPNDGTLEHLRFSHYDLFLRNLATGRVYRWASVGNASRKIRVTREQDHVEVAPGAERDDVVLKWGGHLPDPTLARGAQGHPRLKSSVDSRALSAAIR